MKRTIPVHCISTTCRLKMSLRNHKQTSIRYIRRMLVFFVWG